MSPQEALGQVAARHPADACERNHLPSKPVRYAVAAASGQGRGTDRRIPCLVGSGL